MATDRKFCRFAPHNDPLRPGYWGIPKDGVCLNAFAVVLPPENRQRVLLGRINPLAPWDHLGALDPARVEAHRHGWMLPSSQLIIGEAPDEAVRRIHQELLGRIEVRWEAPRILSEVYAAPRRPEARHHWDLSFVYVGRADSDRLPKIDAWSTLEFVDMGRTRASDFVRSHEDILGFVGIPISSR